MEKMTTDKALATARLVLVAEYFGALVVIPVVARVLSTSRVPGAVPDSSRTLFGAVVGAFALVDYIMSLVLEKQLLGKARASRAASGIVVTAVIVGAFGASLAVYGLVLASLGVAQIAMLMFVLCFIHGVHLLLRWPRYAETAEAIESER